MSIAAAETAKDRGNAAFKAGDLALALANYSTAIQLDPSSSVYINNRALVHLKLKQFTQAESDATKAFNLDPSSAKALYRRGLARVGAKTKVDLARADFTEALKLGGGPEVQAELDKLPSPTPPPTQTKAAPAKSAAQPPATTTTELNRTERLRAALAPPKSDSAPAPPPPPATVTPHKSQPTLATESASPPPAAVPTGLMKEVSTRRLTPAGATSSSGAPANSFAKMKEQRQSKQSAPPGLKQTPSSLKQRHETPSAAKSASTQAATSDSSPSALSPAGFELPTGDLSALSIAERELAASPAWQSIASNPSSKVVKPIVPGKDPRQIDTLPSASSRTNGGGTGAANAPTGPAAFESRWTATRPKFIERAGLLQSLPPSNLATILGDSLTPDLLSEIVKSLAADYQDDTADDSWKLLLLRGLTKVRRFGMSVGFLDEAEKADLKAVFSRARDSLAHLEREWEL